MRPYDLFSFHGGGSVLVRGFISASAVDDICLNWWDDEGQTGCNLSCRSFWMVSDLGMVWFFSVIMTPSTLLQQWHKELIKHWQWWTNVHRVQTWRCSLGSPGKKWKPKPKKKEKEAWSDIPEDYFKNLSESLPKRVEVLETEWGHAAILTFTCRTVLFWKLLFRVWVEIGQKNVAV